MRHFVQRVRVQAANGSSDIYDVKSNVSVMYANDEGHANVLAVGAYEDRVRINRDGACFVRKRVILDNFTTPRYIVYPL
jgi:3-phenylpropionate/cinnamic acid dioxygenase small subunit